MISNVKTKIKICCISSLEEAQFAIQAGADAIGFVCAKPTSERTIDTQSVVSIIPFIEPSVATFLLTSETASSNIAEVVASTGVSTIQILPHLDIAESKKLSELMPTIQRVQVIHIESENDLELIDKYSPYVNAFLLDSGNPNLDPPVYGGTGRTHDWSISSEFVRRSPHPVFLAGGLNASNVGDAIRIVRPYGVDLCNGVRTKSKLDQTKLKSFIEAVRKADLELNLSK
jgi:phosphoribosylanthranilate isomerase